MQVVSDEAWVTGPFPFERELSPAPLLDYWREMALDDTCAIQEFAEQTVREAEALPDFDARAPSAEWVTVVKRMAIAAMPVATSKTARVAVFAPFGDVPVFASEAFKDLNPLANMRAMDPGLRSELGEMKRVNAFRLVLDRVYGIDLGAAPTFKVPLRDESGEVTGYVEAAVDPTFTRVEVHGTRPKLTRRDINDLLSNPQDFDRWSRLLPPDRFRLVGLSIVRVSDVTASVVLSLLKDELLERDILNITTSAEREVQMAGFDRLQSLLQIMVCDENLRVGVIELNEASTDIDSGRSVVRSLLMEAGSVPACEHASESVYNRVIETRQAIAIHDLRLFPRTGHEQYIYKAGFRALHVAPLITGGKLTGVVEMASSEPGALDEIRNPELHEVRNLVAVAVARHVEERERTVQSLIKEEFTAIHPVVEWRFKQVASNFIDDLQSTLNGVSHTVSPPQLASIVFRDVFPLYGLSDIRGSSLQRNLAIQQDLTDQLGLALSVIVDASTKTWLPALDELGYRIADIANDVSSKGLQSGDEVAIVDFLKSEVAETLREIADVSPSVSERYQKYLGELDPGLGIVYKQRRAFEDSLALINETITQHFDSEDAHAQGIIPHYYERYRTDGVDYNIYAGQSLLENGTFSRLHLRSLRLWQFLMMCSIDWRLREVRERLAMQLDTAHLILVHSGSLAIRFRNDERQFDVDGAYNIRYEIVKKRIDKALIKGTDERLTQPGMIAVVYEHDRDRAEYMRYAEYLRAANYVTGEIEDVDLEDLPGASGLRALRVGIQDRAEDEMPSLTEIATVAGQL